MAVASLRTSPRRHYYFFAQSISFLKKDAEHASLCSDSEHRSQTAVLTLWDPSFVLSNMDFSYSTQEEED